MEEVVYLGWSVGWDVSCKRSRGGNLLLGGPGWMGNMGGEMYELWDSVEFSMQLSCDSPYVWNRYIT